MDKNTVCMHFSVRNAYREVRDHLTRVVYVKDFLSFRAPFQSQRA